MTLANCVLRLMRVILYADDILLISPSITNLERLLHRCEHELSWLDMSINLKKKSSCLRVGPRCDATCAVITSSTGRSLPWVEEVRYLGCTLSNQVRSSAR